MKEILEELKQEIIESELDKDSKERFLKLYTAIKKRSERLDFQYLRSENDKNISINILKSTVEELTQQKELVLQKTKEVNQNLESLKNSFEELEQYTQIASHDLKSPLRTIGNYAQLLSKRFSNVLTNEGNDYLRNIIQGVKHMSEIISELLEYSKLERNKNIENIDVQDIIHEISININQNEFIDDASIYIPYKEIIVKGHRNEIEILFTELINNAIKYRSESAPSIFIDVKEIENKEYLFSVSDNGLGLEEEYQDKAFLPFQRINHLERPGVGIGLAKCKKSVMLHGGKIWYKQNPNSGTTFYFTIPKISA